MQPLGSIAAVCAAIREDAAAEAERIAREGAAARERLLAVDEGPALPTAEREARISAARRHARELLATEDAADARTLLEAREQWMAAVVERAMRSLSESDRRNRLQALARELRQRLPKSILTVAPEDVAFVEGAVADSSMHAGGMRATDGKLTLDESLEARARRLEPIWRAALGRIWG